MGPQPMQDWWKKGPPSSEKEETEEGRRQAAGEEDCETAGFEEIAGRSLSGIHQVEDSQHEIGYPPELAGHRSGLSR